MTEPGQPARQETPAAEPARLPMRASEADRDATAQRLQAAFADRRLDDDEFHERLRIALTARTHADLEPLTADLPAAAPRPATTLAAGAVPGRFAVAFKSSIRRGGRWRVPGRVNCVVYKGTGWLDLRDAELTEPVTTIRAVAYKSRIDIVVPPGVRVEATGMGVSTGPDSGQPHASPGPDAPILRVLGFGYKGTIEAITGTAAAPLP